MAQTRSSAGQTAKRSAAGTGSRQKTGSRTDSANGGPDGPSEAEGLSKSEGVSEAELAERDAAAEKIVSRYSLYGGGAGLIPVPVFDMAALAGVQTLMLQDLARLYAASFDGEKARAAALVALGAATPGLLGRAGLASIVKAIPVAGPLLGAAVAPSLAAATTYALGRVFQTHFATGGGFLDLDAEKLRDAVRKRLRPDPGATETAS